MVGRENQLAKVAPDFHMLWHEKHTYIHIKHMHKHTHTLVKKLIGKIINRDRSCANRYIIVFFRKVGGLLRQDFFRCKDVLILGSPHKGKPMDRVRIQQK